MNFELFDLSPTYHVQDLCMNGSFLSLNFQINNQVINNNFSDHK